MAHCVRVSRGWIFYCLNKKKNVGKPLKKEVMMFELEIFDSGCGCRSVVDSGAGTGVLHQDLGGKKRADPGFYRK